MSRKRKKRGGLKAIIVCLIIALAVVLGVIVWKQYEYDVSEAFYDGLRGALMAGGIAV